VARIAFDEPAKPAAPEPVMPAQPEPSVPATPAEPPVTSRRGKPPVPAWEDVLLGVRSAQR
jgi:hypothetical protein